MEKGSLQELMEQVIRLDPAASPSTKEIIEEMKWLIVSIKKRIESERDYPPGILPNIILLIQQDLWRLQGQIQILKRFLEIESNSALIEFLIEIYDTVKLVEDWIASRI